MITKPMNFNARPDQIGKISIYEEQREAAFSLIDVFKDPSGYPLLVAEPQQGKTSTAIVVIDEFRKTAKAEGKNPQIIWLTNLADNELRNQTGDRLSKAGFFHDVKVIHHADILNSNKYEIDENAEETLLIIDECHVGLQKQRPFDNFLKKFGVQYGFKKSKWNIKEGKNVYILSISATPFTHVIRNKIDNKIFIPIQLRKSSNYFDLKHLSNRTFQSEPLFNKGKKTITSWLENQIKNFLEYCKKESPGYLIIRSKGMGPEIIENNVKESFPGIEFLIFDKNSKNISKIDGYLENPPGKPIILCIRGSLRAGKTLNTTKSIRMWIDTPESLPDTTIQSIGRCCGYTTEDEHSKFTDTFPIFCNTKHMKSILQFFENMTCIPKGRNNSATHREKVMKGFWTNVINRNDIPDPKERVLSKLSKYEVWSDAVMRLYNGDVISEETRLFFWDISKDQYEKHIKKLIEDKKLSFADGEKCLYYYDKCMEKYNPSLNSYFYYTKSLKTSKELFEDVLGGKIKEDVIFANPHSNSVLSVVSTTYDGKE